jgi:copper chaperone
MSLILRYQKRQIIMKTEKILIANLKCGGCESTIKTSLMDINGVDSVFVNHEEDAVTINYTGNIKREIFTQKLHSLGYPEATEQNGLLLQLKSYASCMVGRVNNLTAKTFVQ